jgi:hypothetical protein
VAVRLILKHAPLYATAACLTLTLSAQAPDVADLSGALERIGEHVAEYYARARSIMCVETVVLQPLSSNFSYDGVRRELKYELRVEWDPPDADRPGEARVVRQLLTVDGRPPRPGAEPGCMDPKPVSPEPLALLLPNERREYSFTRSGTGKTDGRPSVLLDYRSVATKPADVQWHDNCVSIDLPGRTRGRVWVDAATNDVLRLDEHLVGMFDFKVPREHIVPGGPEWMTVERADTSIHYRPVAFHDPDETIMLPASIESLTIIRNAGVPQLRTIQKFADYRRFVTGGRVVRDDD